MFTNSRSAATIVPKKTLSNQPLARRQPRQERALEKVGLMLEAATRILARDGMAALTTNRVAEVAGVSIGTLYQYFDDKAALVDALAARELQALSDGVLAALSGPAPAAPGDRVRAVIRVVLNVYGGRTGVHRLLLQHLMTRGTGTPLPGLRDAIMTMMSTDGIVAFDQRPHRIAPADAFVLTHAMAGVVRGLLAAPDKLAGPERQAIDDALVRLAQISMNVPDAAAP